jgi:hypothetical protein
MLGALPQVSKPTADELAAGLAAPDAPQGQEWTAVKSSNYMRDLVELWGFEPRPLACHETPAGSLTMAYVT